MGGQGHYTWCPPPEGVVSTQHYPHHYHPFTGVSEQSRTSVHDIATWPAGLGGGGGPGQAVPRLAQEVTLYNTIPVIVTYKSHVSPRWGGLGTRRDEGPVPLSISMVWLGQAILLMSPPWRY